MTGTETLGYFESYTNSLFTFPVLALLIFLGPQIAAVVGYRLGHLENRRWKYDKTPSQQIPGATSLGAMLALLGLLLGFSFSAAMGAREGRQTTLVEEANAISTAFLTADLLQDPGRTDLRTHILTYARTRTATIEDLRTNEAWKAFLDKTLSAQAEIWPATIRAIGGDTSDPIRSAVARSVTDMLDAHTRRIAAAAEEIPVPVKLMIYFASVIAILIAGNRSALHGRPLTWRIFVFAALLSVVTIVIFDLDRPHDGAIKIRPDTLLATIYDMEKALAAPQE